MTPPSLGIDVAQRTFVAALRFDQHRIAKAQFDNHRGGYRRLRTWLQGHGVAHLRVGLESTNTFAEPLAQWLHEHGHCVYLLNPERTAYYARSLGQRNKTDPADATTIAAFVAQYTGTPWQPPTPEQRTLRCLTRTRHQLVEASKQLRNQLRTCEPVARVHLQAVLDAIHHQLTQLARELTAHLRTYPALGEAVRRLMTVKGVGLVTAAVTVAELPPITATSDPRALCAWAGLTPRRYQTGLTEWRSRLSRKGNAYLREALFMPALVAKRYNPLLRSFAAVLQAKGKSPGAIIGAVAHKLLRILIGVLRSNTDFDPNWSLNKH
jgi:transposase